MNKKWLIIFFALSACSPNPENYKSGNKALSIDVKQLERRQSHVMDEVLQSIDFKKIKLQFSHNSTSGIVPLKYSKKYFLGQKTGGYVGHYIFIEDNEYAQIVGEAIVCNTQTPWTYDNDSDELIELKVYCSGISILNDLKVGVDTTYLIGKMGRDYQKINNHLVYRDDRNENFRLFFEIHEGIVVNYKLGLYSENTIAHIDDLCK